jgi:hypothetical protein
MPFRSIALALLASVSCLAAQASPGDPFVPAHRTRDGHYVPPNVPPLSGGTHLARHPGSAAVHKTQRQSPAAGAAPSSYADARPIAR